MTGRLGIFRVMMEEESMSSLFLMLQRLLLSRIILLLLLLPVLLGVISLLLLLLLISTRSAGQCSEDMGRLCMVQGCYCPQEGIKGFQNDIDAKKSVRGKVRQHNTTQILWIKSVRVVADQRWGETKEGEGRGRRGEGREEKKEEKKEKCRGNPQRESNVMSNRTRRAESGTRTTIGGRGRGGGREEERKRAREEGKKEEGGENIPW